jgi:large subunit ribosomal protein L21
MKYAIVESGGKQYKAVEGETIEVDKLPLEVGKKIELEDILLLADGDEILVGTPTVAGAKVTATVVDQYKGKKIIVFKYKPKERYRKKTGHRQNYTRLEIQSITGGSGKKAAAKAEVKEETKAEAEAPVAEKIAVAEKKAEPAKKAATKKAATKAPAKKAPTKKAPTKKSATKKKA